MANIEEKVENSISKIIENLGYKLYDVQYAKEGKDYFLRIFIEKENGEITLDDCENVNISLYEDIKTLSRLQIVNCKNINLKGISKLSNLSEILLQNISMNNIDEILGVKSLKKLNLNGSKIENLDKINKMPNLYIEHEEINGLYDEEY